jgi:sulfide:quinone oxidoreductase
MGSSASNRPLSVLIAGGGVAAIEASLALQAIAEERVEVTLLTPSAEFHYRPLAVTEPFPIATQLTFPLDAIAANASAKLQMGALDRVDADRREAWTSSGERLTYDALLVATGARGVDSVPRAVTFRAGPGGGAFTTLLEELQAGAVRRPVFAVPSGVTWPLPLYELALLTAQQLAAKGVEADVTLVTPESRPLALFGSEASDAVARVLRERGIRFLAQTHPVAVVDGDLSVAPGGSIRADAVVTLPVLIGPAYGGLPHDKCGFLPTDLSCVVDNVPAVFAAGDVTAFPIKQGGIAAQQAEIAAQEIALLAGASVRREPFRPVLRGRLLTGGEPLFLRAELYGGGGDTSTASTEPLWWPPGKIFGRYLGPYLAQRVEALTNS